MILLHLVPEAVWRAHPPELPYEPASLAVEGFVHCTGTDDVLLAVANHFYRPEPGPMVVLSLEEARVGAPVSWEAPDPTPPPGVSDEVLFPHVYGPIDLRSVVAVRRLQRDTDGAYVGFEAI